MFRTLAVAVAVGLLGSACAGSGAAVDGPPLVITTTTILGDLVAQAGGDAIQVEVLMPIGADPHDFSASARQAARLRDASLIVANGIGLEESLLNVIESASGDGVAVLLIGDLLDPEPFFSPGSEAAEEDEGHGLDPHVWMDPSRMASAVELIADRLGEVGVDVGESAAAYRARILDLDDEIRGLIDAVPADRRKLVTNHFSFGYYAERYGLTMLGTVIPAASTGAGTSAADFAELVQILNREDVSAVFGSTTEPTALAEALADEVGHDVKVIELFTGSLGGPGSGAETYLGMMRTNTRLIVENL